MLTTVADPDLQIRGKGGGGGGGGGGDGNPDPKIRGARSPKKFFRDFGPHFGRKLREGRPRPLPPSPSPGSTTGQYSFCERLDFKIPLSI